MNYLKSYLFLFLFLIVGQAQGQYMNEGDLLVGGNGNIRLQFGESDNNVFSIGLSPTLATFVTSNLAVGGSLGLGYSNFSNGSTISFGLTPLLRYYYPTGENAAVFGDAYLGAPTRVERPSSEVVRAPSIKDIKSLSLTSFGQPSFLSFLMAWCFQLVIELIAFEVSR